MSEFKPGDRVQVKPGSDISVHSPFYNLDSDRVYTVLRVVPGFYDDDTDHLILDDTPSQGGYLQNRFQLYTEETPVTDTYAPTQPGKKYDNNKAPIVQGCLHYFPNALQAVANVSKFGATKYNVPYSDKNWARLDDAINRYTDALGRHLVATDTYDPESDLLHAAHAAWDALARLELILESGVPEKRDIPF